MQTKNNISGLLTLVRQSIDYDYLAEDWHEKRKEGEEIRETESGYLSLERDTIETEEGHIYHDTLDNEYFGFDEIDEVYRDADDIVLAYGRRGAQVYTCPSNCEEFRGDYYVSEYLSDNDIYTLHDGSLCHADYCVYVQEVGDYYHTDDVYFWESDDEYHLEPEDNNNTVWQYSEGPTEKYFVNEDHEEGALKFGFGMEIEKNEMPSFDFNKRDLHAETGATIERDGSVSNGFELKTPVYNLFSKKTDERLSALKNFADVKNVENAGGHIGFSMEGKNDEELLNLCRGFLPLIYAMHKKRMNNSYCTAKKVNELISDGAKMQSIRLRGNYIEFRIFSSVKSYKTVLFRLSFFRILAQHIGANFSKVILMCLNTNHPLHKLLTGDVYADTKKFSRLIHDAINIDRAIGEGKLTQNAIDKINERLKKIESAQA